MKLWPLLLLVGCAPMSEEAAYKRQDAYNVCVMQQHVCSEMGHVIWGAGCKDVIRGRRWACVTPADARQALDNIYR